MSFEFYKGAYIFDNMNGLFYFGDYCAKIAALNGLDPKLSSGVINNGS